MSRGSFQPSQIVRSRENAFGLYGRIRKIDKAIAVRVKEISFQLSTKSPYQPNGRILQKRPPHYSLDFRLLSDVMAPTNWADPAVRLCRHGCPDKTTCGHTICCRQWGIRAAATCAALEAEASLGVATPTAIPEAFDSLPPAELLNIAQAVEQWQSARNVVAQARVLATAAEGFSGSQQDDDQFGNENPDRPSFEQYTTSEDTLLADMQTLRNLTTALIAARRPAWQGVTSGQWLNNLIGVYNADITAQTAKLVSLPGLQVAAMIKLAERTKTAGPDLGTNWIGSWTIGSGGFATAHLWLKQDQNGIVEDRAVIKDTNFNASPSPEMWNDVNLWTGGGPEDANSVPNEVQAMYNLRGKIGSETILKVRNWKVRRANRMYRTITEYCPGGDLWDLTINDLFDNSSLLRYWKWPNINLRAPDSEDQTWQGEFGLSFEDEAALAALRADNPPMVPEPFIWSVIEALATAGLLMERGELDSGGIAPWEQIVHCDIKHENMFISPPNPQRYAGYPQLKLADFGMALLLRPNDTRVPDDFQIRGTMPTMAPEQHKHTFNDADTPAMMSSATNVYGMGAVVWQMLSGREIPRPTQDDGTRLTPVITDPQWVRRKNFVPPPLDATAQAFYSLELIALTYSMCQHDDQARPTFDEILRRVHSFLRSDENPAPGLREAPADSPLYQGQHRLELPAAYADTYYVGLALNAVPMGSFDGDADTFIPPPPVIPPPSP